MAEKVTPRSADFSQWYQDVVLQARLADYSPVKGCMVIRPNGYSIWERIQTALDTRFKATGHSNAYFPMFIPESFLKKEAEHVEGFAPECAVVTHAGGKKLEEPLVVRPTSETIINSMFAKWIKSYRDLPMLLNQWANVVRWEMRTRLFLRTTEFLWQEGHTCHETSAEAQEETLKMLEVYRDFAENILAMPVIAGQKTPSEKFAGADSTYCIEAMLQDGKALQAGTSHNLGQNFARAFETKFQDRTGQWQHVFQTSWGVSTRLIGGLIMTHSDDKGLVLPPRVSRYHVVIVPITFNRGEKTAEKDAKVLEAASNLASLLKSQKVLFEDGSAEDVRVLVDDDVQHSSGWKFHEYELIGIPIRIEIGPRDLENNQITFVRRDKDAKSVVNIMDASKIIPVELVAMQRALLEKARAFRRDQSKYCSSYSDFKNSIEDGGFFYVDWCGSPECEAKIKEETKATIRCVPFDYGDLSDAPESLAGCLYCQAASRQRVILARAY